MLKWIMRKLAEYQHAGPLDEWRPHNGGAMELVSGGRGEGLLMRRKVDGKWVYRYPTADESSEYSAVEMW